MDLKYSDLRWKIIPWKWMNIQKSICEQHSSDFISSSSQKNPSIRNSLGSFPCKPLEKTDSLGAFDPSIRNPSLLFLPSCFSGTCTAFERLQLGFWKKYFFNWRLPPIFHWTMMGGGVNESKYKTKKSTIWVFPWMVVPPKHPKMIVFSRKTNGC